VFPATNVKYILDKIFSYANYNYQSNFLNGDVFKNLYIPFNKAKLTRDINNSVGRFTVGATYSMPLKASVEYTARQCIQYTENGAFNNVGNYRPFSLGKWHIPFNMESSPLGDPDNLYNWNSYSPNNDTYYYQAPSYGFIAQQFVCEFDTDLDEIIGRSEKHASCLPRFRPGFQLRIFWQRILVLKNHSVIFHPFQHAQVLVQFLRNFQKVGR
jgi:hypothetical protein